MNGAVERSVTPLIENGFSEGAGETVPLNANGYFERRPHLSRVL